MSQTRHFMAVTQKQLNDVAMLDGSTKPSAHEREPVLRPGSLAGIESEDLARFEGEGGLEGPEFVARRHEELTDH